LNTSLPYQQQHSIALNKHSPEQTKNRSGRRFAMLHDIRMEQIQAILFDFEGTLVDFQWKLTAAIEETLLMLWNTGFAKERLLSRKYSTLMTEAMQMAPETGITPDQVREKIGSVYDRYDEDALTRWALRPRVKELLSAIKTRGIHTALVSNVGGKTLSAALSKHGLTEYFDVVLSRNDVQNLKPHPDVLKLALRTLGTSRENCMLIGDSLDDVHAAKSAGIRIMIITDGENAREDILAAEPDYVIQSYDELLAVM
jgi:2-haloalkanoic acid dehalogenase type II